MGNKIKEPNKQFNEYIKYSSLAVEMIAAILLGAWLGKYLDKVMGNETPVLTLLCMLLGVGTSVTLLIKRLKQK